MLLNAGVRRIHEHRFEIFDVLFDSLRFVAVGPMHDDVRGMALLQLVPLLIAEHVEVQVVERGDVPRDPLLIVGPLRRILCADGHDCAEDDCEGDGCVLHG